VPNKKELKNMINEYLSWYSEHGNNYKSVGWNKPKHFTRFEILLDFWEDTIVDNSLEIIDLGCGLAHLAEFIKINHPNYKYVGIDINGHFIELNKKMFPEYKFYINSADTFTAKSDLIVASGLFNRRFNDSELFFNKTVNEMIKNSKVGCSFNCLSETALKKNDQNFYISMDKIESIVDRKLIDGFVVNGDSIPGEITVHLRKKVNTQ
jgi:SAM-dependent methyltransferase